MSLARVDIFLGHTFV